MKYIDKTGLTKLVGDLKNIFQPKGNYATESYVDEKITQLSTDVEQALDLFLYGTSEQEVLDRLDDILGV